MRARVLAILRSVESATAGEIASALGCSRQSVTTTLCWLRGEGLVLDDSETVALGDGLFAHFQPHSPIHWRAA